MDSGERIDEIKAILGQIRDLLSKYHNVQAQAGAEFVAETISLSESETDFQVHLNAWDIWGGAGSILDLFLGERDGDIRKDRLLRELLDEMTQLGIATQQVANRRSLLDWLLNQKSSSDSS